ncbi:MAG: hypothetical protein HQM12_16965 [SAR324 cluster bacterium]|nr:hypothetical protein [SAR324 cluster bacterium]
MSKPSPSVIESKSGFWNQHYQNWKTSGLHQKQYCLQHGLSYHSFKSWRLKESRSEKSEILVPLQYKPSATVQSLESSSRGKICIVVKNRFEIQLEEDFSAKTLGQLLSVLEGL